MKYHSLGHSAIQISRIGFGCMSLGSNHEANARLLQEAQEGGINYFDTADLYNRGENEVTVGKAFRDRRLEVVLATKVGNQWRPDGSGWDWNPSPGYMMQAVEASLKRLQTDYIDLYQLHGGTLEDPINEIIGTFEKLKEQGKIRAYGISSLRPSVVREYVSRSQIDSVMIPYSLLDRRPEESVLPLLEQYQISGLARGSLAQGLLLNKPARPYLQHSKEEIIRVSRLLQEWGAAYQLNNMNLALGYVWQHPAVGAAVLGIRTQEQLREALKLADFRPLPASLMQDLGFNLPANYYDLHR